MRRVRNFVIIMVIIALLAGSLAGAVSYLKKTNQKEVLVASVDSLASEYYSQDTSLEGYVTTNVSQNVYVESDTIVEEVFVQKGDSVKKGNPLVSFDMTLVEMELNIARLKKQQQEQNLNQAEKRLQSLKNGGPIEEYSSYDSGNGSSSGMEELEEVFLTGQQEGYLLAAVFQKPLLAAMFHDGTESGEEPEVSDEPVFSSGEDDEPLPVLTPTPALGEDTEYFDPYPIAGIPGVSDGEPDFYQKLTSRTVPFAGKGTEADPFIYLCSSAKGKVIVDGSFFNKMAGYNEDGTAVLKEGGYWYQLEFHQYDTITNFEDRRESCIGYYLIDGSVLESPLNMTAELEMTLEDASTYDHEPEIPEDDSGDPGDMGDPGDWGEMDVPDDDSSGMTREDAIKAQENLIASLKLDITESELNISKLEKKVQKKIVSSKLDGIVDFVGDPLTASSSAEEFIKISNEDGIYIKGSVSELLLEKVQEGTILNCMSYESGSFQAEVMEVAEYPSTDDNYWSSENPNVSYYSFHADIMDKTLDISEDEWINITLQSDGEEDGILVLPKAFVRTENGVNYVYKDENGILKKQLVTVGGNVDDGYSVMIKGGLTREDYIAFPYGKSTVEGAKTKEGTLEEMYGY